MRIFNKILFITLLLVVFSTCYSQNQQTIDSLNTIVNTIIDDTNKVNCFLYIGEEYEDSDPEKAKYYYIKALSLAKELNEKYYEAECLFYLGYLYRNIKFEYDTAEYYYSECLKLRLEFAGNNSVIYASSLNNLALLYREMGKFDQALRCFLDAITIYKNNLGEIHPLYVNSIGNLALLYHDMDRNSEAEELHLKSVKYTKMIYGENHYKYAMSICNLSSFYYDLGNLTYADSLLSKAYYIIQLDSISKKKYFGILLNNWALIKVKRGNVSIAKEMYNRALEYDRVLFGDKSPSYSTCLSNYALLIGEEGNYKESEKLLLKVSEIDKENYGESHNKYALSLNNLGYVCNKNEKYSEAEEFYEKSKEIYKNNMGIAHPDYAFAIRNLANLYYKAGDYSKAELNFISGLEFLVKEIFKNFSFLSEKEKELYFESNSQDFDTFYSFSYKRKSENPAITNLVYNFLLINKGILLKSSTALRNSILNSNDSALINKYGQWILLRKEISKLYSCESSKRKKSPEELEFKANNIEKELVKNSQSFSDFEKLQSLHWETVRSSLKNGEAAIEFLHFKEGFKKDSTYYCALLITSQSKYPEMIKLFEENQILNILNSTSGNDLNRVNNIYGTKSNIKDSLYNLVWKPIEKYLGGIKKIYYSPDGILHKISFASIRNGMKKYLSDCYNIQQLSSTGKIVFKDFAFFDKNITVSIFGGVDYSSDSSSNNGWQSLQGTLQESKSIEDKLIHSNIKSNIFTGRNASEDNFKLLASSSSVIHIATHGFFYPDPEMQQMENCMDKKIETGNVNFRGDNQSFGMLQIVRNKNPLMRSGIVLAGANKIWNQRFAGEGEDGILTAQEVTQLDLSKTKLVVLSACETGLGDIKGSEGVYGLQRAFKMAGVKYIIMSLWQVPDKETVEFMDQFYKKLLKTNDVRNSFNETQKVMRQKYDPYFWGAFVLIE